MYVIAKRLTRNERKQYSHAVLICWCDAGRNMTYTKQMSVMSFHPSGSFFGDFVP